MRFCLGLAMSSPHIRNSNSSAVRSRCGRTQDRVFPLAAVMDSQWRKRLPLSGSRRIVRSNSSEDAVRGLLNVLQALQEEFGIPAVESDVILRGSAGFKTNRRANDIGHRLRF